MIYLAGGMTNLWRKTVKNSVDADFADPCDHRLGTLSEYGAWDLHHVQQADIVFCYIERDNPSCLGAAVEVGYGAGNGATIILVLEPDHNHFPDEKVAFLESVADVTYQTLEDGIQYLSHYA